MKRDTEFKRGIIRMYIEKAIITKLVSILYLWHFFSCSYVSAGDKDKDTALRAYLVSALSNARSSTSSASGGGKFPIPTCEVAAPTFSTLKDSGVESTCGRSGCHNGSQSPLASSFTALKSFTVPGDPATSTLYTKQSVGTMAQYTTQVIDKAIYCWIKGGSNP